MKIAHINENNKLLGWYDKDIHTKIPAPNIEVTDGVWQNAINNRHNKVNEDGSTETFDFRTADEIAQQELSQKLQEAKTYLDNTDHKLFVDYEPKAGEDIEAIKAKRKEARDFIRNN